MTLERAGSIDHLRLLARRRVPRFVFDFVDGGAETERCLRRNREAFEALEMVPRYLVDVSTRRTEVELFGRTWGAPFGIAPMGLLNLTWPGTDAALARLARVKRIPHLLSTNASTSLEAIAEISQGHSWLQIYIATNDEVTHDLIARAKAAGYENLVVTVDCPVAGKRDRDIANGFKVPFAMTPGLMVDLVTHPAWSLAIASGGTPNFESLKRYRKGDAQTLASFQAEMITGAFELDDLSRVRDAWKGRLIVKGILHPADARAVVERGCDGIIVSNHGGRQAAYAPASIEALPMIAQELGGAVPLLLDSGVRRGADIIRAKALGASMVLAGRPFVYGAGAGGEAGVGQTFAILQRELDLALGQLGVPDFGSVGPGILARNG